MPLTTEIIGALKSVLGNGEFGLHEPTFNGNEKQYLIDCINTTFVSSVGAYVDKFEKELATFTGARRAVAVVNGTAALQIAYRLAGVQADDEVIVPAITFVATANAVRHIGAVPHFVDCEEKTLGIDPVALRLRLNSIGKLINGHVYNRETGRRISAVVAVHTFGHPCDLEGLLSVTKEFNLQLVEDAAESLGSYYKGQHTGTFGQLGCLSFNGNKTITTGGGGAILTNNEEMADRARHLTTTARLPHAWEYEHDEIGYNFRLPNLNAAVGCAQMEQLSVFLASKRRLFSQLQEAFDKVRGVVHFKEPKGCHSNYWLQTLLLDKGNAKWRDEILQACNEAGLMMRPVWKPIHTLRPFLDCPHAPLPVAESLAKRALNPPSSAGLV